MKTEYMEIALASYFGIRQNLIVPNVSWGMDSHECDLFVLTPSGCGWEIEIKISKSDLFADKNKRHGHHSSKIKFLYFAIPDYLKKYINEIPERAGIIVVSQTRHGRIGHTYEYCDCTKIKSPNKNSNYKYTDLERMQLARLGALRIWGLKRKLAKLQKTLDF